jgi:hypothetical protein
MKKLLLAPLMFTTSLTWANDIYLICNVSGGFNSNFGRENFRPGQVSVEITNLPNFFSILIDGVDDYIASASTGQRANYQSSNLSDSNKFSIVATAYPPSGNIKSQTTNININRVSGILSVSTSTKFHNGNFIDSSYSGTCNKASVKKF